MPRLVHSHDSVASVWSNASELQRRRQGPFIRPLIHSFTGVPEHHLLTENVTAGPAQMRVFSYKHMF